MSDALFIGAQAAHLVQFIVACLLAGWLGLFSMVIEHVLIPGERSAVEQFSGCGNSSPYVCPFVFSHIRRPLCLSGWMRPGITITVVREGEKGSAVVVIESGSGAGSSYC